MPDYLVTWEMNITADSPLEAAQRAWHYMRTPDSTANVFDVTGEDGRTVRVDLERGIMTPREARACVEAFHNDPDKLDDRTAFLHGWEACLNYLSTTQKEQHHEHEET